MIISISINEEDFKALEKLSKNFKNRSQAISYCVKFTESLYMGRAAPLIKTKHNKNKK